MSSPLTYEYHLNRIKDELKLSVACQLNRDIYHQEVYLFDSHNAKPILTLLDLLNSSGKCLFGISCRAIALYKANAKER
jgi:hypothetical protein